MNCVHCGAELSDREEICTLCGELAKVPDAPTEPPAAASETTAAPAETTAPTPVDQPAESKEGAAFCSDCKKFVYLDASGCCDKGHPVSAMTPRGSQTSDAPAGSGSVEHVSGLRAEGMYANNSGLGSASSLPSELEGVNWGAFFLTWIWGIGNRVWLSFLVFVPGGNYVMPWVLLIKGNEWAWKNKRWQSVQEFREVQRKWALIGIVLTVVGIVVFSILWFLLASAGFVGNTTQTSGQIT